MTIIRVLIAEYQSVEVGSTYQGKIVAERLTREMVDEAGTAASGFVLRLGDPA
jgi:predicted N-acetyltransferase YhbS